MKSGHWFLPARKPIARDLGPCAGANAYCCDTCRERAAGAWDEYLVRKKGAV